MDTVAQPLPLAISKLEQANIKYAITVVKPAKIKSRLENTLYVIRQRLDADGIYNLIVAAKMGKEVF